MGFELSPDVGGEGFKPESLVATLLFKYRSALAKGHAAEPALDKPPADADNALSPDAARDRWWYESSYDLRCGLDVDDDAARTLPGELIDELFKR